MQGLRSPTAAATIGLFAYMAGRPSPAWTVVTGQPSDRSSPLTGQAL